MRLPELRIDCIGILRVLFIECICDEAALVFHFLEILQSGVTGGSTMKRCSLPLTPS
jgi:hypothetical protein